MKKKFNSKMIIKIVIADILILAASLLTFAYFDHVRGWGNAEPMDEIKPPSFDLSEGSLFNPSEDSTSKAPDLSSKEDDVSLDMPDNSEASEEPSSESTIPDGVYTDGEVISTETVYKSKYVSVELKKIYFENTLYMVEDIYVKHIESLAAGFAKGLNPLSGEKTPIYDMVEYYRNNGYNVVAAINGDYFNRKGATIRNGVLYGDGIAQFEVCVLYKDGTMVTMPAGEFDAQTELSKGAWHVWDFGPSLLDKNGEALTDFSFRRDISGPNPRTAIGYYEPGHYCFVVAGGRGEKAYGVSLAALARFMESMDFNVAYNLDGGKSSIMVYGDEIVNAEYQDTTRNNTDMVFIQDFPAS